MTSSDDHRDDRDDHRGDLLSYATTVARAEDVDAVYEAMADAAETAFDFSTAVVETEADGVLSVRSWSGRPPTVDGIGADEGIAGDAYQTGDSQLVDDVDEDPRVEDPPEGAPRSVITVPIGDVGVFQAGMDEPAGFGEDDVELAELLASHAYQAVQRIRSQQELRESESRFRALFEQTDDALVLYDVTAAGDTVVRFVNDAAESLLGVPESELRGDSLSAYVDAPPDQFRPGEDARSFDAHLADDGDRVSEVTVKPFLREDGPDAFAVVSDVTEQRHRERTLTGLHDATREMLVEDDPNAVAHVIVSAASDLLDLPYVGVYFAPDAADELRPAAVSDAVAGEVPVFSAGDSLAWNVYESGEPAAYSNVHEKADVHNPETPIREEIIHPLGDHGVLMVGATETNAFDQTDRDLLGVLATNAEAALDRAERVRQLRTREAELRRERNRLAALFENVPSPTASFVVEDGAPVVQSVNSAFEDVFGYDEEELVGSSIDEYIVPSDEEDPAETYNRKLVAGRNVNAEVRRLTDDGPRDFLLDVVPFRLDEPNVHGYAMYTDITDRKERERELERQNDRLEEFASIVSHDLRNPLNVAQGYLELAEQTGEEQYFRRMDDALDRMHDIIESVLELARHGRSLDDVRELSLSTVAGRAWRNVDTADATLEVDDATLEAEPSRFESLLENLFRNAVEHAGTDAAVTVGPLQDGESDDGDKGDDGDPEGFYVADDGPGIPVGRREAVFEHGETRNDEGTGFGLAIVKSVAEAHGWTPTLTDSDAGGARFEFRT